MHMSSVFAETLKQTESIVVVKTVLDPVTWRFQLFKEIHTLTTERQNLDNVVMKQNICTYHLAKRRP